MAFWRVLVDFWSREVHPIIYPLLLAEGLGTLFGFLLVVVLDVAVGMILPPTLSVAERQRELRLIRRRMWMVVGLVAATLLFQAIVGLWYTGGMNPTNFAVALVVVAASTILLLAPIYTLFCAYLLWKWRRAK